MAVKGAQETKTRSIHESESDGEDVWVELNDPSCGDSTSLFFVNLVTGESTKKPPQHTSFRAASPDQWWELWDEKTGRYYYFNTYSRQTVWHRPTTPQSDIIPLAKIQALQLSSLNNAKITSNNSENSKSDPKNANDSEFSQPFATNSTVVNKNGTNTAKCVSESPSNFTVENSAIGSTNNTVVNMLESQQEMALESNLNLLANSQNKQQISGQISTNSCHRHHRRRHEHHNSAQRQQHRHNNHSHHHNIRNTNENQGIGIEFATPETSNFDLQLQSQSAVMSHQVMSSTTQNVMNGGNDFRSVSRQKRTQNSDLTRANSEHRKHHRHHNHSESASAVATAGGSSRGITGSSQRNSGYSGSSISTHYISNNQQSYTCANKTSTSSNAVSANNIANGTSHIKQGSVSKQSSGRFLRSGCFGGCSMQNKNCSGCVQDTKQDAMSSGGQGSSARGQEGSLVEIGSGGLHSHRRPQQHHHHRCNKHRKQPQHSNHTQTPLQQSAINNHAPLMDEATREIIGRSLMASSSSGLVPGNVASGHSPQQNATVNQLQQNQPCHRHFPQNVIGEQQKQSTHRKHTQQCSHESSNSKPPIGNSVLGMNNTASMTRKAAPPVPRTQVPFSQNSFESAVSANPQNVNELPKPQNVVALENRISGKSRAHMPLPVPLEQTGVPGNFSAAPGNASQNTITTPPFSNYAVNGSTPSPIANNKSSSPLFAAGNKNGQLGLRGDIGSPSDNNGPSQQGFGHLGSPNPFQTTTHVSVPNNRKMRRQDSDSSNQFSTSDGNRSNNQNRPEQVQTRQVNKLHVNSNKHEERVAPFNGQRSATPHLDPTTYSHHNSRQHEFNPRQARQIDNNFSNNFNNANCQPVNLTNVSRFQLTNNFNLSSDNLICSARNNQNSNDNFNTQFENDFENCSENENSKSQLVPFRNCKSHTDLFSDSNFISEVQFETENYNSDYYENLRNATSLSTDALYENTNNTPKVEDCQKYPCEPNVNSRNPFENADYCQRFSRGSRDFINENQNLREKSASNISVDSLENAPKIRPNNYNSNTKQDSETYETLTNYTSSMLYENRKHSFPETLVKPNISFVQPIKKNVHENRRSFQESRKSFHEIDSKDDEVSLMGRIYDDVANTSDEEEKNLMENLENLSGEEEIIDDENEDLLETETDLMLNEDEDCSENNNDIDDDNVESIYNENESEIEDRLSLLEASSEVGAGNEYENTTMSSECRESVYSIGAKFTPPASRDILADSKLNRRVNSRSSNSPARPPKGSNLEMTESANHSNFSGNSQSQQNPSSSGLIMGGVGNIKRNLDEGFSQESLSSPVTNRKNMNAAFSSKESMLSTPSDCSEQSRSIQLSNNQLSKQSYTYDSINFQYHKFPSTIDNTVYTIESESLISGNMDNEMGEGSFTRGDDRTGAGMGADLQNIYDQPCSEQEYLLYETYNDYDDPDSSDATCTKRHQAFYENNSILSGNDLNEPKNSPFVIPETEHRTVNPFDIGLPVGVIQEAIFNPSGSLDSNNRSLTNNQQTNSSQNAPALPFSRGVSGSGATLDLARKSGLFKKKQTTSDVMKWTKDVIREPLIADKRFKKEAVDCFKLVQQYMGDRKHSTNTNTNSNRGPNSEEDLQILCAVELAVKGWEIVQLRDELILQVCKQSIDNSRQSSVKQGWELLAIFLSFFAPSDRIVKYLEHFLIEFTLEDDNDEERESGGAGDRKGEESVLGLLSEGDGGQLDEDVLGITTTLEKLCSIPCKKYAVHCWKQMKRMRRIKALEDNSTQMMRSKRPTVEEVVAARNGLHQQPVFGSCLCDLIQAQKESEIKSINSLDIPWILHALISQIVTRKGHLQEGILRVSGDAEQSQKLKVALNSQPASNPPSLDNHKFWQHYDTNVLARVLKQWLRQLDEPLIPMHCYSQFINSVSSNSNESDITAGVVQLAEQLNEPNRSVLQYLIAFLQVIVDESESNKMTSRNIALVIAPNCLWSQSRDPQTLLQNSQCEAAVIQALIESMASTKEIKDNILQNFSI